VRDECWEILKPLGYEWAPIDGEDPDMAEEWLCEFSSGLAQGPPAAEDCGPQGKSGRANTSP
jgi:hypothetical protein